jgi:hypothetical protein
MGYVHLPPGTLGAASISAFVLLRLVSKGAGALSEFLSTRDEFKDVPFDFVITLVTTPRKPALFGRASRFSRIGVLPTRLQ